MIRSFIRAISLIVSDRRDGHPQHPRRGNASATQETAMEPHYQLLASVLMGVFVFLYFLARDYFKSLGWMLGPFDPNLGYPSEAKLISAANKTMLVIGALLMIWAFVGPSPYRRNWELEAMGLALGALACYVLLILLASFRSRSTRQ